MTDDELVRELRLDAAALKAFGVPNMAEHNDTAADLIESLQARIAELEKTISRVRAYAMDRDFHARGHLNTVNSGRIASDLYNIVGEEAGK